MADATETRLAANVATIQRNVDVYRAVSKPNARQKAALAKNLATLARNKAALAAYRAQPETSIYFGTWADAKAGRIDLSTPSRDTYGLLIQWAAAGLGWATAPAGSVFAQAWEDQAEQIATSILAHGEDYYPERSYPVIPAPVLDAIYGTSDPVDLRRIIENDPYFATLRQGGAPYNARPEMGG